jgi:hypothetical protein
MGPYPAKAVFAQKPLCSSVLRHVILAVNFEIKLAEFSPFFC